VSKVIEKLSKLLSFRFPVVSGRDPKFWTIVCKGGSLCKMWHSLIELHVRSASFEISWRNKKEIDNSAKIKG